MKSNWYKLAQQMNLDGIEPMPIFDFHIEDYYEMYDEHLQDIISEFKNGQQLSWHPVPLNKLIPVYKHFTQRNYLDYRDVNSLHEILRNVISNIARLDASTALCGHDVHSLEDLLEQTGYSIENDEEQEKFYDFMEFQGHCPISDYGLPKLQNLITQIPQYNNDPRQLLVILNQMLDVIHQRNDLASWLIEGGTDTLLELSRLE